MKKAIITLGIIILLLGGYIYWNATYYRPKELDKDYETQLIEINKRYSELLETLSKKVSRYDSLKPHIIEHYIREKPTYIINNYIDSTFVVIDTIINDTVIIHKDFLTNFPTNPKLVNLSLTKDSLDLVTMNLDGDVIGNRWPMDLDNYDYMYIDNKLTYKPTTRLGIKKNKWNLLYLNAGYEFVYKDPYIGVSYVVPLTNRLSIAASATVLFSDTDPFTIAPLGVGYRLLK